MGILEQTGAFCGITDSSELMYLVVEAILITMCWRIVFLCGWINLQQEGERAGGAKKDILFNSNLLS
jgi:hypothetical protein